MFSPRNPSLLYCPGFCTDLGQQDVLLANTVDDVDPVDFGFTRN